MNNNTPFPRKVIIKIIAKSHDFNNIFSFFSDVHNMTLGGAISDIGKEIDDWYSFKHKISGKGRIKHTTKNKELVIRSLF
jgi:hypothetical protein